MSTEKPEVVSLQMVKFVKILTKKAYVDVVGIVSVSVSPRSKFLRRVIQQDKFICFTTNMFILIYDMVNKLHIFSIV